MAASHSYLYVGAIEDHRFLLAVAGESTVRLPFSNGFGNCRLQQGREENRRRGMSRREDYETRTEGLLAPIAAANGVSVYDVEYVKEGSDYYLRAYIDKPEGVNIQDCENVSRALSDMLDREDFIPDAYILEVSSPGLGRALKKDRHLQASLGEEVEIKLFKPLDKCKEFAGILESFDSETLTVREGDAPRTFRRSDIALVRLALKL